MISRTDQRHSPGMMESYRNTSTAPCSPTIIMKMPVDDFRHRTGNSLHRLQVGQAGARHRLRRSEMQQQRPFALGADARDFIQRVAPHILGPALAMGTDGEAVAFIAQTLDEIENRITRFQQDRRLAGQVDTLASGIAFGALGHPHQRHLAQNAQFAEHLLGDRHLPLAAVDDHQLRPVALLAVGILLQGPGEPAGQHLAHHGEIVAGVIFNPGTDELYTAEKGGGAFLNDRRIRVAARRVLSDCVVGCGVPHLGRGDHGKFLVELRHVMGEVAGVRRLGAASLDLAYVAAGRFDGHWEIGLSPWDIAAGLVLIREAGGFVSDIKGSTDMFGTKSIVAGNELIQKALLEVSNRPVPSR